MLFSFLFLMVVEMRFGVSCFIADDVNEVKKVKEKKVEGVYIQALRADISDNCRFFSMVAWQTLTAKMEGSLIARRPEIDILLRIAGTTQIERAIDEFGLSEEGKNILLIFGDALKIRELTKGIGLRRLKERTLTKRELYSIEKAALLSAERFRHEKA